MKTLINFKNPLTKKRQLGCLDVSTKAVHTSDNQTFSLSSLKKKNQEGGIGFFETRQDGIIIQKSGEYHS